MRIIVLGSAAGGGFPQWNCACPVCSKAWSGDPDVRPRTQSSIAVSADGERWLLLNASPDIRAQILATPALRPARQGRHSPIAAVLLTNGDVDHVAGLLTLREKQPFVLYGTQTTLDVLRGDSVFGVLDRSVVEERPMRLDARIDTGLGLLVTPFAVPGKVPLYLEGAEVDLGTETESVVAVEVADGRSRFVYAPGCAAVTPALRRRLDGAPLLFFDGTTFTDDEMPRLGLSPKTARRMGHMPMSGPEGSLAALAGLGLERRVYIHINNTNPVLVETSPERAEVEAAGWRVAHDGMEFEL
ncbi:pyrroloquinoline quinone biosynthesis protein PqqB [Alsobacter sp. SYSU BS001988]